MKVPWIDPLCSVRRIEAFSRFIHKSAVWWRYPTTRTHAISSATRTRTLARLLRRAGVQAPALCTAVDLVIGGCRRRGADRVCTLLETESGRATGTVSPALFGSPLSGTGPASA